MRPNVFAVMTRKAVVLAAAGVIATLGGCAHRSDPTPLSVLPVATTCDAYNLQLLAYDVEPAIVEARQFEGTGRSIKPFRGTRELLGPDTRGFLQRTFPYTAGGALIAGAIAAPVMIGADIIALPFEIFGDPTASLKHQRRVEARAAYDALVAAHRAAQCAAPQAYLARPDVTAALTRFDAQVHAAAEPIYRMMVARKYWGQWGRVRIHASDAALAMRRAGTPNPFGGRWREKHAVYVAEAADLRGRFQREGHVVSRLERLQAIRAAIDALPHRYRCYGAYGVSSGLNKHYPDAFGGHSTEDTVKQFVKDYRDAAEDHGGDTRWPERRLFGSPNFCPSDEPTG